MADQTASEVVSETGDLDLEQAVAMFRKAQEAEAKPTKPAPEGAANQEASEAEGNAEVEGAELSEQEPQQEHEGESAAEQEEPAKPVKLKLDDGREITADEALKGYLRTEDYTRKTQSLAQKERDVQSHIAATLTNLENLHKEITALRPQEPDWLAIKREYPDQWQDIRLNWEIEDKKRAKLASDLSATNQKALQEAQLHAYNTLIAGDFEPKWRNPQALNADIAKLAEWAKQSGASVNRINAVSDAFDVIAWEKARRYDEIMKLKPVGKKMVADKPKPQAPGAKPRIMNAVPQVAVERFQKTRSLEDAAALYSAVAKANTKGASQRRH